MGKVQGVEKISKKPVSHSPAGFKREMRFWKFAGVLIPRKLRKQVRPVFALLSTANGIVCGVVRAVFAVVRRQDGGSPCGGRRVTALPSVTASCDPPVGRDKRGLSRYDPRGRSPFMALLYTFTTPAPYAITLSSCDIRLKPSLRAWVISIRSNGSECIGGRPSTSAE